MKRLSVTRISADRPSASGAEEVRLGLIGYPLGHSRSPQLHHGALRHYGLKGEYRLYPIAPDEAGVQEIAALLERLRAPGHPDGLRGLNVTIPHKATVLPFLDRLSETARAVGAVNTLYVDEQGRLCGDNTDVPGFLRDLDQLLGDGAGALPEAGKAAGAKKPEDGRGLAGSGEAVGAGGSAGQGRAALVLGAGGSARAVAYALARSGWQVRVLARRVEQAAQLIADLSGAGEPGGAAAVIAGRLAHGPLTEDVLAEASRDCNLLVNTTPLGMHPNPQGCPWPDHLPLPAAPVYDLIYNPSETVLLRRARAQGLPASNGAGMLVAQAALAFSIWTGLEPPYEAMGEGFSE